MKVIIAPDKFKGSLTSFEACEAIVAGIAAFDKTISCLSFPMADGGDGFAAVMKHYLQTDTMHSYTEDPLGRPVAASYELKNGVAIIEMAAASGLVLLKEKERNALKTSTKGTGLMINDAIHAGAKKIILGLGGSATNDAGTGILEALGFLFLDKGGHAVNTCGENLVHIDKIIPPTRLPTVQFEIACDVQNTLYGEQGAAFVYAPQKGALPEEVRRLDDGLRHFSGLLQKDIASVPGTGAAGGIAAGLMGFFDVRLQKGVELVMDTSGIRDAIGEGNLVITGEGKIDKQSSYGKVVGEIALLAGDHHIPAIAFCGITEVDDAGLLKLQAVRAITPADMSPAMAMANAAILLQKEVKAYFVKESEPLDPSL
ncbi:glycerate kinase [Flavitalea sp. BT771]|uniref:glycerate kinase family protein n=1 Tax=Flavitalea sp. BT771 TaxID=3063329 RepID=UPI0026E27527|nr:glycerate kinase [Flavitalea sp. BT771]MDO6431116.1 glycerate kinase [Flavitalea sp. BT771]MDV6220023.1 glycerate kinase [Flavitalea sp. BT771]